MVVISFFLLAVPLCVVVYWLGRGVSLNHALKGWQAANEASENGASEEALVNIKTGEVLEPGTRKYSKAIAKGKVVRFE